MAQAQTFEEKLALGLQKERAVVRWLVRRGATVLPAYEVSGSDHKGPRLFSPTVELTAPDMLVVAKEGDVFWLEVKYKTAFSWYRNGSCWVTGINIGHFADYRTVARVTPWPVWVFFLHTGGVDKDEGSHSPAGLYAGEIDVLSAKESHRSTESGMVYWAESNLKKISHLKDLE